jgi:hypothetical protein
MATSGDTSGVRFASGSDADDGDYSTALVAAISGKKIRVMSLVVTVLTTAGVVSLKSDTTTIFAQHLALGVPLVVGTEGIPICETAVGAALIPSNGTGVDSFVNITYQTVEP